MSTPPTRRLRVLLAEDHPINRAVVEVVLSQIDVELLAVENGAEAVDAFRESEFDVVLMDLQMPVMDGLTAIREMRAFEEAGVRARTPILAVTANALAEHVAAAREAGADLHIAKPIVAEQLISAICERVSGQD
ncbi:response regulator [Phenylobacterium sp.]|uniref:response regulator n=1 Tax=Phenylobacterium sp. TaxID=1871053 RepID=UPI002DF5CB3A|nr:response regulator [Phenylobacterium sp.]